MIEGALIFLFGLLVGHYLAKRGVIETVDKIKQFISNKQVEIVDMDDPLARIE